MLYTAPRVQTQTTPNLADCQENIQTLSQPVYKQDMTHTLPAQACCNINQCPAFSPNYSNPYLAGVQSYQLLLEEAREIRFTGQRLPFIFYFNQITELLQRCPQPSRKMDLLRASCQDEAREAVSALVPPVPGWEVDTQVKRALEGLRLRFGCCSFLTEPPVKRVRSGPKISKLDANTLEKLISDLNDCELYARAHRQSSSLDSSFIIDIGERLQFYFKNR